MAGRTKSAAKGPPKRKSASPRLKGYVSTRESVGFVVREVYRLFARCLQPRIAREGVTIGMWFVLRMLWDEDGLTQRELSERVGINGPTMVTAINSMERADLVKRVPHETDRRKTNVFLTERGRAMKAKLWPAAAEVLAIGFKGLTREETRRLSKTLAKIRTNLEADRWSGIGRSAIG
jgi:DNA-binding MarR family transcriptional regulator